MRRSFISAADFAPHPPKPALVIPDPISITLMGTFFIAITLVALRRPAYGACALIAAQPFAFYQETGPTTITLSKVSIVAVLLALFAYRDAFASLSDLRARRFVLAGVLLAAATLLTYVQAQHHVVVLRETAKAVEYVLIFCCIFAAYRLDPDRSALRMTLFCTIAVVCGLALAQEIIGAPSVLLMNGHTIPRIGGPLEGPNQLAGYLDVALPIAMAFAIFTPSPTAYALIALAAWTGVLTFSRGGAAGAAAAVITIALVARGAMKRSVAALAIGLAAGAIVAVMWGSVAHAFGLSRFWSLNESADAGGVGVRSTLWRAAVKLWREHPLLGIGAGNFQYELPSAGVYGIRTHANNLYLQSLVEGGIPLFGATLWLVYLSIASWIRDAARSPFVLAALAASVALAVHQFVDFLTFYPKIGGTWWALLALASAEIAVPRRIAQPAAA